MTNTMLSHRQLHRPRLRSDSSRHHVKRRRCLLRMDSLEDRAVPATFHVALTGSDITGDGSAGNPFRTVQFGINAAAAAVDGNDIVEVAGGTYATALVDMALNIPNSANLSSLQLSGGWNATFTIQDPTATPSVYVFQNFASTTGDLNVLNDSTTISSFTWVFDGQAGAGAPRTDAAGIVVQTTDAVITNNKFEISPRTAGPRPMAIENTSTDVTGLEITNNSFTFDATTPNSTSAANGIFINPDVGVRVTPLLIDGNTFTGDNLGSAIVISTTSNVDFTNNSVIRTGSSNTFLSLIDLRQTTANQTGINIHSNDFINLSPNASGAGILTNGNSFGAPTNTLTATFTNNNITGNGIGIAVDSLAGSNVVAQFNALTGNGTGVLKFGATVEDFTRNWWDDITGPTVASNVGGAGESITGPGATSVTYSPWLLVSPDSNPGVPGVQLATGAGIVTGTLAGGVLTLTGDDARNIIQLSQVGTDITVTGTGTTIVGGTPVPGGSTFSGVTSIKTAMKGGDDVVTIDLLSSFSLSGAANFDLGDGSNILSLITTASLSLGSLTAKAGDGDDTVAVAGGTVTGNASLNLGVGRTLVAFSALQVNGGGGLKVNATDGDDLLRLTSVQVPKAINASTGNGSLTVKSTGGNYGSMSLKAVGNTPSDPSQGVALNLDTTSVTKAVKLNSKAGAQLNTNGGTMGSVSVTAGKLGTAEVNLNGTSTVNGGFTVKGAVAAFNVVAGTATINGNLKVNGTSNTLTQTSPGSAINIGGGVSALGETGAMSFIVEGTSLTVGKTLTVKSQSNTLIQLTPTAASQIKGNVSVTSGVQDDVLTINNNVSFVGNLTVNAGAGNNDITLGTAAANLAVGRNLSVTTLGGNDVIELDRLSVTGTTKIKTGAGSDLLDMTGPATFTGATTIDLGAGDDEWRAANDPGTTTGPVTFTGKVNAKLGAGNDTLILGLAVASGGNANTLVGFSASSTNKIDGGSGLNLYDDGAAQTTGTVDIANF